MYIDIIAWWCLCFAAVATVGFHSTAYTVSESDGVLQVCATVTFPSTGCPINTPFSVNLLVNSGTAGEDDYYSPGHLLIAQSYRFS